MIKQQQIVNNGQGWPDAELKKKYRVLIIEDDDGLNRLIEKQLRRAGYKTQTAFSGEEALSRVDGHPYQFLLLDYMLPDMTGAEFLERLHSDRSDHVPYFITITGQGDEYVAVDMMKLGARDYIIKEHNFIDLLPQKLENALRDVNRETELKKAHNEIEHLNRVLRAVRNVNSLITGQKDPKKLIRKVCDVLVSYRGYHTAWLALLNEKHHLLDLASVGFGDEFRKFRKQMSQGIFNECSLRALGNKNTVYIENLPDECRNCPLLNQHPGTKAMTIQIEHNGKLYGLLSANICEEFVHYREEQHLFQEVARDVALALHDIEVEEERNQAVRSLEESEEKFRIITENSADAIFICNKKGDYQYVNKKAVEMLGFTREELLTMNIADVSDNGKSPETNIPFKRLLEDGKMFDEITLLAKGNNAVPVDINAVVLPNGLLYGSCRNITERKNSEKELKRLNESLAAQNEELEQLNEEMKQTNEKLREAKERAEESDRLKSMFLANMSHEIRTPMNGILGFADLLKDPKLTIVEQLKFVDIIENSGRRMLNTINDLISISKIEAGQMEVDFAPTDINKQLDELFYFFKPELEHDGLTLSLEKGLPDEKAIIQTDSDKFYAIFTNLLNNAKKFTPEGSITFGYVHDWDYLTFYVEDTGVGIPDERQEAIFDRFVQANLDITKPDEGSGLGLSITKAYVELLDGTIWVESAPGEGAHFFFTLPYDTGGKKAQTKTAEKEAQTEDNSWLADQTILIVEDEEMSDLYLTELLKNYCKKLLHAPTGRQAMQLLKDNPKIDLILMDIKLPEMDGLEVTREIRKTNQTIRIIAQTAYALEGDRQRALDAGCNDYVSKPIKKKVLFNTMKTLF